MQLADKMEQKLGVDSAGTVGNVEMGTVACLGRRYGVLML